MALIKDSGISVLVLKLSRLIECTFQFKKYFLETSYIFKGRIDNASVAFLKSVSIF